MAQVAPRTVVVAAAALLFAASCRCTVERNDAPAELVRLVAAPPGTLVPTYTLGDETRPVLALPAEIPLWMVAPSGLRDRFSFPLPASVTASELIATGTYQRGKRLEPLQPQLLTVTSDDAGARTAALELPVFARGSGPEVTLSLVLTAPVAQREVETETAAVTVPVAARLHLAYALSEAAGVPGAAPVTLSVSARGDEHEERELWSVALDPATPATRRWSEAAIDLAPLAGRAVHFVFRARAAAAGRPLVFPLWADPTVVAPAPRPPARRNLILISLDTLRADHVGVYGAYRPTTPAIDALAAEGVVFSNAWAHWPETSGSHMTLFTSRLPSEHGVTSFITAPAVTIELLAERLRREGYLTRAFTEDGGVWAPAGFARGFSAYAERRSPDFVFHGEVEATFADATRFVETHGERRFFLFIHTYEVHAPYTPPRDYRTLFTDIPGREPLGLQRNALAYDREARHADDQIGPFVATLRRLGLAEDSIVIVTSDHGEEFGEHGGMGHGRTLHREALQVPLIVWAPGLLAPARVDAPVGLVDVAPTILDLLGLAADPGHRGVSLIAAARAAAATTKTPDVTALADRPLFAELDRTDRGHLYFLAVRQRGRTAIRNLSDGTMRCYAAADPAEQRPTDSCPDLADLLAAHRQHAGVAAPVPVPTHDPHVIEKMRALGYVE